MPSADGILPAHAPPAARRAWAARQSGLCLLATAAAERSHGLRPGTLGAIARVETGVRLPVTGDLQPWPWTVNVGGTGHWYPTRTAAAAATAAFLRTGGADVDVGCLQVSMRYHRAAFPSLDAALDPASNVDYGATLLRSLARHGNVDAATGRYHSATPALGDPYRATVLRMRRTARPTLADVRAVPAPVRRAVTAPLLPPPPEAPLRGGPG